MLPPRRLMADRQSADNRYRHSVHRTHLECFHLAMDLTLQYFTDGLDGLIRVDSDEPVESKEFFFATAEKLGSDGAWYRQPKLILEILNSGYYRPIQENDLP